MMRTIPPPTGLPPLTGAGPGSRRRRADPRLPAYLAAGFGGLILAIATGQPEFVALGAPFLALASIGLFRRPPHRFRGGVRLHREGPTVEGDIVGGEVWVEWEGEGEVDVIVAGWRGVTPIDPAPGLGWSLPLSTGPVTLPFKIQARLWGVHDLGNLWVRARRPGGFAVLEQKLASAPTLRILPTTLRLSRLLRPAEPRTFAGSHLARLRGHGTDFAEFRPYQPGDRLRDLSWATSARLGDLWVKVSHPERAGTIILVLDTVFTDMHRSTAALARAARAAWAMASAHLRAQDRVGLLARGRTAAWLPPRGGTRAKWMLLHELLSVGRAAEDQLKRRHYTERVDIPPDALIVGITSLRSQVFAPDLLRWRRSGHTTVALLIDTDDLLPEATTREDVAARRIWYAQRAAERNLLERGGILTSLVTATDGVGPTILSLRRRLNAQRRTFAIGYAGK